MIKQYSFSELKVHQVKLEDYAVRMIAKAVSDRKNAFKKYYDDKIKTLKTKIEKLSK